MNNIYLSGFSGSGKSTLGFEAANFYHLEFVDLDQAIEQALCKTIPAIFAEEGEEYFRQLEYLTLQELTNKSGRIIALGGGTMSYNNNYELIKAETIIFIDRPLNLILSDLDKSHRPLMQGSQASIKQLYQERYPFYQKRCSTIFINNRTLSEAKPAFIKKLGTLLKSSQY